MGVAKLFGHKQTFISGSDVDVWYPCTQWRSLDGKYSKIGTVLSRSLFASSAFSGNKKVAVRAPKARVLIEVPKEWGVGRGCPFPSPLGRDLERGLCPLPRNFFNFWSSNSLVLVHFSAIFVGSSATDGLLRNDCLVVFNVFPYISTVL